MDIKNNVSTNLKAYWELEESSGDRTDSHTGGYTLTQYNGVASGTGIQGTCASFDKASSEYLRSTSSGLQITGDISWCAWIKPEAADSRLCLWNTFSSTPTVSGLISALEKSGSNFFFRFANYASGAGKDANFTSATFTVSTWAHIAFTYDVSAGEVKVYKNGSLVETQTGFRTSTISKGSATFGNDGNTGSGNYYNGLLDEMGLWDTVLSDTDISNNIYNSGTGIPYDAGGAASGPASLKTRDTIAKASIKTIDGIAIASVKTLDTIA